MSEASGPQDATSFTGTGGCLCGQVRFGLIGQLPKVGFCHCSQCRKASGTGSNAVMSVRAEWLVWLSGEDARGGYTLPTGWTTSFCERCGCPTPHQGPTGRSRQRGRRLARGLQAAAPASAWTGEMPSVAAACSTPEIAS